MVQKFLTTEQKKLLQTDLRESAKAGGRKPSTITKVTGGLSGQQKLDKQKFIEAGGTKGTGVTSVKQFTANQQARASGATSGVPTGFEFLNAKAPKSTGDATADQIAKLSFERNQALAQARALTEASKVTAGQQEQQRVQKTEKFFQEKGGKPALSKEIANPAFAQLSEEEKKINAQLPIDQQVKQFVTLGEADLSAEQKAAQEAGIAVRFTEDQKAQRLQKERATKGVTTIDPSSGKKVLTSVGEQLERVKLFLNAEEGDTVDVDADGKFFLRTESGEVLDPVQRAEDKVQKQAERNREVLVENRRIESDRIKAGNTMANGKLSAQGKTKMNKMQIRYNRNKEEFEESVDSALDSTIRAEKKRQLSVEDRQNAISQKATDPLEQLKAQAKQQKVNFINDELEKDPTQNIDFLMDKYNKQQKFDAKSEENQVLGQKMDAIMDSELEDVAKFQSIYDSSGKDINKAFGVFKSRFGEAEAGRIQDEYLKSTGHDEETIKVNALRSDMDEYFDAPDNTGLGMSKIISELKKEPTDDLLRGFLNQALASPNTSIVDKIIAEDLLEESEAKVDVRGGVKTGFVQIIKNPDGTASVVSISKPTVSTQGFTANPQVKQTVEDWASSIMDGTATIGNIPDKLRNSVNSKVRELVKSGEVMTNKILTPRQLVVVDRLSKQVNSDKQYSDTLDVASGFDTVAVLYGDETKRKEATGFDDVTVINAFQRMIDPGATVREGDVELLKTTVPFLRRIDPNFKWEQFKKGDVLPPDVRKSLFDVAAQVYDTKVDRFNSTSGARFKRRAEAGGIPFDLIGSDFTTSSEILNDISPVSGVEANVQETNPLAGLPDDILAELETLSPEEQDLFIQELQ